MGKKVKFSVKLKYMIFTTFLIALSAVITAYIVRELQTKILTDQIKDKAVLIIRKLKKDFCEACVTGDELSIMTSLNNLVKEKHILYAFLLDSEGKLKAHHDPKFLLENQGKVYNDPVTKRALSFKGEVLMQDVYYEKMPAFDISAPIYDYTGKKIGVIRMGYSKKEIEEAIRRVTRRILKGALISIVLGIIGSFLLSTYLMRPIKILTEGSKRISTGNFDVPVVIKRRDEFLILADAFNQMQESIKKMMQEIAEKEAIKRELEIAGEIQKMLIPKKAPEVPGCEIAGFSSPSTEVGGDYYDFFVKTPNCFSTVIADVSGHGLSSSLIMVMVRTIFKTLIREVELPSQVLATVNQLVSGEIISEKFVTMYFFNFYPQEKKVITANAGHLPLLWFNSNTREVVEVDVDGLPVGIFKGAEYAQKELNVNTGDILLLTTDGITETTNPETHEMFGINRLKNFIINNASLSPQEMLDGILNEVKLFSKNSPPSDDRTLVIVKVK